MDKKIKEFYKTFPEYKMFDKGYYWEEKAREIRQDFYFSQFIESLFFALKFGLGIGLAWVIFYATFTTNIKVIAENVCPLLK